MEKILEAGRQETINSIEKYSRGRIAIRQDILLQEIRQTSGRARIFLHKGMDTSGYARELKETHDQLTIVQDGITANNGSGHTTRNLAVSWAILNELLLKVSQQRDVVSRHIHTMVEFIDRIDSLSADSALYTFPLDSAQVIQYFNRLKVIARELGPVDTLLRKSIASLQHLQTSYDMTIVDIRTNLEDVERFRRQQDSRIFRRDFSNLWHPPSPHRPLSEIIPMSIAKEKLALKYYLRDFRGRLILLVVLIIAAWRFLLACKKKWADEKGLDPGFKGQLVFRYPSLSAVLVVISIFQFLFLQPPFIFSFILWLISAVSLCIIFYRFISPYWMLFWTIMVALFVLAGLTNMVLEASRMERWWMFALASGGAVYCTSVLRSSKHQELREKNIRYFIVFVVLLEAASVIFNATGRYNLAKTLMVAGYSGLVIAILFIWTARLINEALVLIASIYKHPERKLFYINFERVGEKVPTYLYVFLVIGWFVLVGKNFYAFQQATTPLMEFLGTERTIGNYDFTINSLVLFVVIIGVSTLISQVISFFAAEPGDQRDRDKTARQPGVGSWLLLIRIFVLSLGLFLAFAAAGIPMDKLAIVLGALGVGIGLGLQGLVSNLVSGLIIAFEKPVNVGDIVEVNGKMGTMKSIGFRSSIINLTEGASFIIPNSDLLTNHLINWTMGNNRRRINVAISVNYGTDLKKVNTILETVLKGNDYVMHYPAPSITVVEFAAGSINIAIDFWVADIRDSWHQRSDMMSRILESFDREGIEIPLPQQEITIKK
ncbi:hypothetical protein OI18_13445 [Flavihumibacter solisilvae]|uniref:Mechanosensitive ion channel protein n=2 Tax=Flavihumibacter solisilvae TaxID=1349421 RepID=A0A0C1LFT0_9BACT|nr:hypothetical protein OI18_13445 [Flavihumibacter solisilvae]